LNKAAAHHRIEQQELNRECMVTRSLYLAMATCLVFGTVQSGVAVAFDVVGASTIQPIIDELRSEIEPRVFEPLDLRGGGSGAGIRGAREGTAVGMVSRALSNEEKRDLKYVTIGFDALAVIVNKDNPVSAVSKSQIVDLFAGRVSDWSELGGHARPVVRVSKEVGRSTLDLFEDYSGMVSPDRNVTDGRPIISKESYVIGSNLQALTLVGGMPGAIGYVSLGSAQAMIAAGLPVKVLSLDGVMPSAQTIVQRSYPIVRELNMVYLYEGPAVSALNALLLSARGQDVVESHGFLRAVSR